MKLITKKVAKELPRIYSNEDKDSDEIPIVVKFFDPMGSWTWYATEADALIDGEWVGLTEENYRNVDDIKFFGYVDGDFPELGYFTLSQLKSVGGIGIERDHHFSDKMLGEVMK